MNNCELVNIILINFNNFLDTSSCIKSIKKSNYENYEIVIVDNDSSDNSYQLLNEKFSDDQKIKFLKSNFNGKFGFGNNIGISMLFKIRLITWILNNDTIIENDTLSKLLDTSRLNSKFGCVGATIKHFGSDVVHTYGGGNTYLSCGIIRKRSKKNETKLDYISGTSMFIRKDVLKNVGMFDETFFMYWEDVDLSLRIAKKWDLGYSDATLYHKISASIPTSNNKEILFLKNIILNL